MLTLAADFRGIYPGDDHPAVYHSAGRAGSGKTRVVCHRLPALGYGLHLLRRADFYDGYHDDGSPR